jgi:hypothetical protein
LPLADDDASSASGNGDGELAELVLAWLNPAAAPNSESLRTSSLLVYLAMYHIIHVSRISVHASLMLMPLSLLAFLLVAGPSLLIIACMVVLLVRLGFDVTQRSVEPPPLRVLSSSHAYALGRCIKAPCVPVSRLP